MDFFTFPWETEAMPAILAYRIPPDNPFINNPTAEPEIWAYGVRNVWRFSFDQKTGQLWAGDVGQTTKEEIDIITKGGNFGWNIREGLSPYRRPSRAEENLTLIDPIIDLKRDKARSIIGGYVYRGKKRKIYQLKEEN